MTRFFNLPPRKQVVTCVVIVAVWLFITLCFVGLRFEHIVLAALILGLFFATDFTRRLIVALLPFVVFGMSYDWMNICRNYKVNPIDVEGLYNAEKSLFGITLSDGSVVTLNEFFLNYKSPVADFLAGVFYLCWVPLPIFFGLWLYFTGKPKPYLHFALVFLLVNLLGFTYYYIHPAAPPWYVQSYGFEPVVGTTGQVAGLGAFDNMTGWHVFEGLYSRNSNVFAALPSLHSAYTLVAAIYAFRYGSSWTWRIVLSVVTVGIWCTAVYTSHHYVIDVLLGITCAFLGFVLFEYVFMRFRGFRAFMDRYTAYITGTKAGN